MTEDLKSLIRKRGALKSRLTAFQKFLDGVSQEIESVGVKDLDNLIISELDRRAEKHDELFVEFNEVQSKIEYLHENFEEQLKERTLFENSYYRVSAIVKNILDERYQEASVAESVRSGSSSRESAVPVSRVVLPQIKLPYFDGSYETWVEFRDTFVSLVHKRADLDNIEKFHYVRGHLQGDAKQVIESLEFSAENYNIAWNLLCDRYNNKRLLVDSHLKSLFNGPSLNNESSADLRKMLDNVSKHTRALESLGVPTNQWDMVIIFHLASKLDKRSEREWETIKTAGELPKLEEFRTFLKEKASVLEKLELKKNESKPIKQKISKSFLSTSKPKCPICKNDHYITNCHEFLSLSVNSRLQKVKDVKLCINCLKPNHQSKDCRSSVCRKCNKKHHTLLHFTGHFEAVLNQVSSNVPQNPINNIQSTNELETNVNTVAICNFMQAKSVLLSTSLVQIKSRSGKFEICRVLLDSGSQSNFITVDLCNRLGLTTSSIDISIVGINKINSSVKSICNVEVHSLTNGFKTTTSCLVLPTIAENMPNFIVNVKDLNIPSHIRLADPKFNEPAAVDMLIGADLFYSLLCRGQISLGPGKPMLQKTVLGWVISGPIPNRYIASSVCNFSTLKDNMHDQLAKFWEIEECDSRKRFLSKEEQLCEDIFVKTVKRNSDGAFVVDIPLKMSPYELGESKQSAFRRFIALENRLNKDPAMQNLYVQFMSEYISLGHMLKIPESPEPDYVYYIPHHGVINEHSSTTKLRVVFDASNPTDSNLSFNDIQCVGPTIQDDLLSIMLRFRKHKFVVGADIEKMYRMIKVNPAQTSLQRIFWRPHPSQEIEVYTLNTVTYGTASAPFLATRCLQQLSDELLHKYPEACELIRHDFYVDDFISGGNSIEELSRVCGEVSAILKSASFNLRKWTSNSRELLSYVSDINPSTEIEFGEKSNKKLLGLFWSCYSDSLMYNIKALPTHPVTKRSVLGEIAHIFDPLGLLCPTIIVAKIMLQKLWELKLSWDESLPSSLHDEWCLYRRQLPELNQLKINRLVVIENPIRIELHGYADASQSAYGCCVYLRSIDTANQIQVSLLCAKSKVAPLKYLSIPRLELCACLLLAQLVTKVKESLQIKFDAVILWSDSTIVLSWLRLSPHLLNIFVANRISQIQTLSASSIWRHVSTNDNPADLASRGVLPSKLITSSIWWNGPQWLKFDEEAWPQSKEIVNFELPELKTQKLSLVSTNLGSFGLERFSNLARLNRVMAYCFRYIHNSVPGNTKKVGPLTADELNVTLNRLVRLSQRNSFQEDYGLLSKTNQVHKKSKIHLLNPFIDSDGIIRVGGRLQNSNLNFDRRHPMLLSCKEHLTKLIFEHEHLRLMHAGPQQLLATVREKYWPISGRSLAKRVVHNCVRCYRVKPKITEPLMGSLPKDRITPASPFEVTGVDYAGPIPVKDRKGRGSRQTKGYICLFVCFTTKCVHLEFVSELTTECFIAAFRRFVSRRGAPVSVYSDNGTNFVGANAELMELGQFLKNENASLTEIINNQGVNWHFIPAHSPHFGGLWEAGVKSVKHHLKRVTFGAALTFEDMSTVLIQIEAILNSRPLCPLSSDPNDLDALTPAHFLIGKSLTSLPNPNVKDIPTSRLSRFQHFQQLQQHFWSRWALEYIHELQVRGKWRSSSINLKVNDLVLLKEDNLPPLQWCLGRIVAVHPGKDGIVRVVSVKTKCGVLKRSVAKVCPLPSE